MGAGGVVQPRRAETHLEPFLKNSEPDNRRGLSSVNNLSLTSDVAGSHLIGCEHSRITSLESSHLTCQIAGPRSGEARLPWDGYVPRACNILLRGYFFTVLSDVTVRVTGRRPTSSESFHYDLVALRKLLATIHGAKWPDADLHDTLRCGSVEDVDNI